MLNLPPLTGVKNLIDRHKYENDYVEFKHKCIPVQWQNAFQFLSVMIMHYCSTTGYNCTLYCA